MRLANSIHNSIRYRPRAEWAQALRGRALVEFAAHDRAAWLQAFRDHGAFYTQRLAGIANWADIAPLGKHELAELPVSRNRLDDEGSHDEGSIHEVRTSGTSGFQVTVRNTVAERRFRQALAYRPFLFYPLTDTDNAQYRGAHPVMRQVIFVDGTAVDAADKPQWPFKFGAHTYLTWRVGIAGDVEQILALLQGVRPQIIRGLASGIVRFAEQVNRPLPDLGVQVVSPSGEQLLPAWRELMTAAFGAPVMDRYGATETGSIAWQCPYCNDYHANSDEIILEPSPAGLLATPLFIESQPLLRYQLGDRVALHDEPHDCRIRLPKLTVLDARRDDWLIDGAGRKVSPLSFRFERVAGLQAWRIHQLRNGELLLYFDAEADGSSTHMRQSLAEHLQAIVPNRSVQLMPGTWRLKQAGKYKRVVSDFVQ